MSTLALRHTVFLNDQIRTTTKGDQNISSVLAIGNLGIEGTTDLARENLIAASIRQPSPLSYMVPSSDVYTAATSVCACLFDDLISAQQNR
jgi:hypothetical protein